VGLSLLPSGRVIACGVSRPTACFAGKCPFSFFPIVYWIYRSYQTSSPPRCAKEARLRNCRSCTAHHRGAFAGIEAQISHHTHHLRRVQVYAVEIARISVWITPSSMPFAPPPCSTILGSWPSRKNILSKPGRLTPERFEKMKIHPGSSDRRFWLASSFLPVFPSCAPIMKNGRHGFIPMGSSAKPSPSAQESFPVDNL